MASRVDPPRMTCDCVRGGARQDGDVGADPDTGVTRRPMGFSQWSEEGEVVGLGDAREGRLEGAVGECTVGQGCFGEGGFRAFVEGD